MTLRKIALTLWLFCGPVLAADPAPLAYPHGYRQWTHLKTMQIKAGHPLFHAFGGIHHVYANKTAVEGMKRGRYGTGSTFVLDLFEPRDEPFAMSEGPRKLLAVMRKDRDKYAQTGGWGFEAFRGDSRKDRMVGRNGAAECFRCHAERRNADYVFSTYRN